MPIRTSYLYLILGAVATVFGGWYFFYSGVPVDFNREVRPILNKHCLSCHGGIKQSGNFSLLFPEDALGQTESGLPAIVPGHPGQSEMIRRLKMKDPEWRMPLDKPPLNPGEIKILEKWIKQGAQWDTHWAYNPVPEYSQTLRMLDLDRRMNVASIRDSFPHEIDWFISQKLLDQGLSLSREAEPSHLWRRLSLDITGLPPDVKLLPSEGVNRTGDSYIDSLLLSPHFGEKWAAMWLDLARYADTKGYERDDVRTIWKYRDWLIRAFNEDKPYNQFLIEQLAGDQLDDPTIDQLLATAFHRNTMTNDEGGTDNEEFRTEAVLDRVNTTWESLMGTTFSCVQCHTHPYDPIRHEDYYRFMAFFNNTRDEDTYDEYPVLRQFSGEDSLRMQELQDWLAREVSPEEKKRIEFFIQTWQPSINSLTAKHFVNSELSDTKWLVFRNNGSARLMDVALRNNTSLIIRYRSFLKDGTLTIYEEEPDGHLLTSFSVPDTKGKWEFAEIAIQPSTDVADLLLQYNNPRLKNPLDNGLLIDWFHFSPGFPGEERPDYDSARTRYWELLTSREVITTPIMLENPKDMARATYVFERGNWLSKGKAVTASVPGFLAMSNTDQPSDRLELARWMTDRSHPLTARVYVNRIWEQLFGRGLVETLEDFGTQGATPSHPELLDFLAAKFMDDFQCSTKALIRYIVTSRTYRQSSVVSSKHLEKDPQNRLLSRAPRPRLTAEQIRDQALAVSGLLNREMYGPGIMPYQPEGIWNSPYNSRKWIVSEGTQKYRRAIYTYWKRTSPYPSMLLFDMMARDVCTPRRIPTNTPLQALVTLNDPVYVETAQALAECMIREGGPEISNQIKYGYEKILFEAVKEDRLEILMNLYNQLSNSAETEKKDRHEYMTLIASAMMNLDEFLVKN